jgi:hypothetical protein
MVLEQIFTVEMNARIRLGASLLYKRAKQSLEFANAAAIMFRHAKRRAR